MESTRSMSRSICEDAAFVRSHFDGMTVSINDAPKADEIVVVIAVTDGGRPHPRVGGLTKSEAKAKTVCGDEGVERPILLNRRVSSWCVVLMTIIVPLDVLAYAQARPQVSK